MPFNKTSVHYLRREKIDSYGDNRDKNLQVTYILQANDNSMRIEEKNKPVKFS